MEPFVPDPKKHALLERLIEYADRKYRGTMSPKIRPRFAFMTREEKIDAFEFPLKYAVLMGDGPSKDVIFAKCRQMVEETEPLAVIFCTDAWVAKLTPEGVRLAKLEPKCLHGKDTAALEKAGYAIRTEVLLYTVQNDEEVIAVQTPYEVVDGVIRWGEQERMSFRQSEFDGRQKMFGAQPSRDVWHGKTT